MATDKKVLLVDFIKNGVAALESIYPTAEARSIVLILCEFLIGTKSYTHLVEPAFVIPASKIGLLEEGMDRLKRGEPIQYVTGRAEFCGLSFKVNDNVLIPRPETELLCRKAITLGSRIYRMRIPYGKKAEPVRILDLCTGSGCIAWKMALSVPGARVVATDISEEALGVARSQEFSAELREAGAEAPKFIRADVLQEPPALDFDQFDLVLSNPPYIMESEIHLLRKNVLDFEPASALFVKDEDPLVFYRAIAHWSQKLMSPEGFGMTEINELLGPQTEEVFRSAGFQTELVKDFYDKKRFIFYHK